MQWVKRYEALRRTFNMEEAITQLAIEIVESIPDSAPRLQEAAEWDEHMNKRLSAAESLCYMFMMKTDMKDFDEAQKEVCKLWQSLIPAQTKQ